MLEAMEPPADLPGLAPFLVAGLAGGLFLAGVALELGDDLDFVSPVSDFEPTGFFPASLDVSPFFLSSLGDFLADGSFAAGVGLLEAGGVIFLVAAGLLVSLDGASLESAFFAAGFSDLLFSASLAFTF